jgi:hypothetical protein
MKSLKLKNGAFEVTLLTDMMGSYDLTRTISIMEVVGYTKSSKFDYIQSGLDISSLISNPTNIIEVSTLAETLNTNLSVVDIDPSIADIDVVSGALDIAITESYSGFPTENINSNYSHSIAYEGGVGEVKIEVYEGSLPTGLTLSPNTGLVEGIPTELGEFTFKLSISDKFGNTEVRTENYSIFIA